MNNVDPYAMPLKGAYPGQVIPRDGPGAALGALAQSAPRTPPRLEVLEAELANLHASFDAFRESMHKELAVLRDHLRLSGG